MKPPGKILSDVVLDSSALTAVLRGEPGAAIVAPTLAAAWISAVNLAEAFTKMIERGAPPAEAAATIAGLSLQIVDFDRDQALAAAALRPLTRSAGLSLGDRACLALGKLRSLPVLTADRVWKDLDLGVEIRLIR